MGCESVVVLCGNCKYKMWRDWNWRGWAGTYEYCVDYGMSMTKEEEMEAARNQQLYERYVNHDISM